MNDPKYTPGKWEVRDKTYGKYRIMSIVNESSKMRLMAKMPLQYEFSLKDWIDAYDIDEVRANANLIAAAPNLYEELSMTSVFLREHARSIELIHLGLRNRSVLFDGLTNFAASLRHRAAKIENILAKARGEEEG